MGGGARQPGGAKREILRIEDAQTAEKSAICGMFLTPLVDEAMQYLGALDALIAQDKELHATLDAPAQKMIVPVENSGYRAIGG